MPRIPCCALLRRFGISFTLVLFSAAMLTLPTGCARPTATSKGRDKERASDRDKDRGADRDKDRASNHAAVAAREPGGGEEYERRNDNPFHLSVNEPLSTFSIDVDTASYTNVRRMLNED